MSSLELTLLGGFRARFTSGDELVPRSKKAALLLARLALRAGEVHTRETLIGLLWSDRGEAQARASLRQELTVLRKMMGTSPTVLAIDGERLSLDAAAVEVDVRAFEALAKSETTRDLDRAASLYRGPLLEGFAIRDAACEEWITLERQRLRDLFLSVLDRLLARQVQEGAIHRAITTAQTLLAHDPLREDAHRTLMLLHAQQGRRSLALKQYQAFSELLRTELGVDPEPETVQLHADILAGRTAATRPLAAQAAPIGNGARSAPAAPRPETAAPPFADGSAADAYQFYQMGRSFFLRNVWGKGALEAARRLFEQAIEIDPNYARAYAALADCDCYRLLLGVPAASLDTIAANGARALELDPDLAEAHAAKGLMLYTIGSHAEADAAFERAVRLGPDLFEAHYFYARNCRAQGLHEKAAELFERSAAINQNDFRALGLLSDEYRALGRLEESLAAARRCLERVSVEVAAQPDDGHALSFGSAILAELGERERAEQWAARANRIDPDDAIVNYNLACTYAALGKPDPAVGRLQATFAAVPINRRVFLEWLQHDTAIDPLRGHPGFVALVERLEAELPVSAPDRTETIAISHVADNRPVVAVLPFVNISGDPAQEHVADGIVEEVTAALSRVRSFSVVARTSTLRYRDRAIEPASVGRELGVRYLLQGSVRASGDRIRITVQLVEAVSGAAIWSDRYEAKREEIFDLQDRITERTVGAIEPTIRSAEIERARRKPPESLEAYDCVMRALPKLWARTPSASAEALRLTTEAVCLDPNYALANALAAWCHALQFGNGWGAAPEHSRTEGLRLAHTALQLDAGDPRVLTMVGAAETLLDDDLAAAAVHIERALALDPYSAWAWIRSGHLHVYRGEPETALQHFERAARLSPSDPLNFNRYVGMALAHFSAGRYEHTISWADKACVDRPGLPWGCRILAAAHAHLGQDEQAQAAARAALSQSPGLSVAQIMATTPLRQGDVRARFAEGLHKAGIPETAADAEGATAGDVRAIAVLPFAGIGGDPEQEHFADGLTEALITDLSRVAALRVVPRRSALAFKGRVVPMRDVASTLEVGYICEGSVHMAAGRIRIAAQLADGRTGHQLWAERYDCRLDDIFAVQDEISQRIVAALKIKQVPGEPATLARRSTSNAEAYQYYLIGRSYFLQSVWGRRALGVARQMFVKAVEIDPQYARAYAGIANCDSTLLCMGDPGVSFEEILANSARALELEPDLAEAHAAKGLALYMAGRHGDANAALDEAVRLGPDLFEAHFFAGRNCRAQGRFAEAARRFERAAELQPNDFRALGLAVNAYRSLGRRDDMISAARRCLERAEAEIAVHPENAGALAFGAAMLAELGESGRAEEWVARAARLDPLDSITSYNLACAYVGLGQFDAALARLQQIFSDPPANWRSHIEWMKHDSSFDPLRDHPGYRDLLERLESEGKVDPVARDAGSRPAIAVLPFDNLTGDPEQQYFADGIVEEITAALSRVRSFFVIARSSTLRYRGRPVEAPRVGSELGVRYLLQGSVRTSDERVRIMVQLIEAASGTSIWADRYEGPRDELFDLEDRITERTVGAIEPTVRSAEIERARRKRPDSLEAYDYVMRALPHVWALTPEASAEALRLTTEAVRLDPGYARANALVAWCHGWQVGNGWSASPESSRAEGMRLARIALELDADDPGVLTMVGATEMLLAGDLDAAANHIGKALALDPNSAWAWIRSGYLHVYLGQLDTALQHFERAARLSPFDPLNFNRYIGIALAHFAAERYRDAVSWAEKARLERPDLPWALRVLAAAHAQIGDHDHAQAAARTLLSQCPRLTLPEIMATLPFRQTEVRDRFAEGLLKAGIVDVAEQPRAEPASDKRPAVAVLPLANLSGAPDRQYFSDGITEDIITELSRWRQLKVMSRNSSFRYRGSAVDVKQVRRDLGVDYVVEGSIRIAGDRIRVTAQLIDAETGSHVWAEHYDRDLAELFAVQGEVVQTIVGTLVGRVQAAGAERAKRKPPSNLAAYDCVLRGLALPWGDPEADAEARRLYERAIELDPEYGLAHALLALMTYEEWGVDPACSDAALDRAFELAKRAVELDENESTCQFMLGFMHLMRRAFDLAEQYHRRAIEMNPSNPQHLADMGSLLVYLGRPDEGLEWLNRARRVDPYFGPSWYWHQVGFAQMSARRYDDAIQAFERSMTMPYWVRAYIAACHAQAGRMVQAQDWAAQALHLRPDFSATWNAGKEPFKHPSDRDHLVESLRKAGIPEFPAARAAVGDNRRSVAVLPFENLGGNPSEQYFSDGITDDIINELSRFHQLIVVARHSSFQYRGGAADADRIARELQVGYLVEGSMRRVGDRIRITAQLIETATGRHLWAERYDRSLDALFDLQDEVARMIASALAVRIEAEDLVRAKRKPPESMSAHDYWLRGKKCLDLWTPEANAEARRLFTKAIESDPEYARGYAGLAFTHEWAAYYTAWDPGGDSSHESARRYAERAVALDDTDHLPHVILGWVHHQRGEFEQAQQQFGRAIAINPNDADAIMHRAMVLALERRTDEAIDGAEFAIRLNPRHPDWYLAFRGACFFRARRYAEAAAIWDRAPDSIPEVRACLAAACVLSGRPQDARRHMEEFLRCFSLHWTGQPGVRTFIATEFSFEADSDLERFADALREAGMPE